MSTGSLCTVEEQALSNSTHGTSIACLTRGDSIGLTLVAGSGFISLVAVLAAFVSIFVSRNYFMLFAKLTVRLTAEITSIRKADSSDGRYIYGGCNYFYIVKVDVILKSLALSIYL